MPVAFRDRARLFPMVFAPMAFAPMALAPMALAALLLLPGTVEPLSAQGSAPARPLVAPSGRVATSVTFDGRLIGNIWLNRSTSHSGPAHLQIDYGQPHARGRTIYGDLVPWGEVWRLGANMATHLRADLNIRLGDLAIPQGLYTLYLIPRPDGAELVVNRSIGQWGTEYAAADDFGRLSMTARPLAEPVESLVITLWPQVAEEGVLPSGLLTITWGEMEYSVDWAATWP